MWGNTSDIQLDGVCDRIIGYKTRKWTCLVEYKSWYKN